MKTTNFTTTLELTTVTALCIERSTKKPVEKLVELIGNYTADTAEKPVKKLLAADSTVAFAMVLSVSVSTAVYEMLVRDFLALCRLYGEVKPVK